MDFLSIGSLDFLIVLLVGLLILGPARTIDLARNAGRMVKEFQQIIGSLPTDLGEIDIARKDGSSVDQEEGSKHEGSEGK